jgi:hypothetical protein
MTDTRPSIRLTDKDPERSIRVKKDLQHYCVENKFTFVEAIENLLKQAK